MTDFKEDKAIEFSKDDPKSVRDFNYNQYSEEQIINFTEKYPELCDGVFWNIVLSAQKKITEDIRKLSDKYKENQLRNFIKENPEKCDNLFWRNSAPYYCNLSEEFIREYKDEFVQYGSWFNISYIQKMSEEFMIDNIEYLDIDYLSSNINIPEDVKNRIINLKKVIDQ